MRIGTTGFNHAAWRGQLYPVDAKESDKLLYYSLHIPTVEINATMHLIPRRDVFERWNRQTPAGFTFAFRTVYSKKLNDNIAILHRRVMETLGLKFGPVSIVVPASVEYQPGSARALLSSLPAHKYALDIRSGAWLNDEVYEVMAEYNVPMVRDHLRGGTILSTWEYVRMPIESSLCHAGLAMDIRVFAAEMLSLPEKEEEIFVYVDDKEQTAPNAVLQLLKKLNVDWHPKVIDMSGPGPIHYGPTVGDGTGASNPAKATDEDALDGPLFEKDKLPQAGKNKKGVEYQPETDMTFVEGPQANGGLTEPAPKVDLSTNVL